MHTQMVFGPAFYCRVVLRYTESATMLHAPPSRARMRARTLEVRLLLLSALVALHAMAVPAAAATDLTRGECLAGSQRTGTKHDDRSYCMCTGGARYNLCLVRKKMSGLSHIERGREREALKPSRGRKKEASRHHLWSLSLACFHFSTSSFRPTDCEDSLSKVK